MKKTTSTPPRAAERFCMGFIDPNRDGLLEGHEKKAWTVAGDDMFQESIEYVRKQLDELRDLGVTSFTLAVVVYPAPDDSFPLHYPSSTVYRAERTYTALDLRKVFHLQQSVSVLVVEHIWDVVPDNMDSGDALLVRVRVNLGADWDSTKIVGYAGAMQIMYGSHNEPFILK